MGTRGLLAFIHKGTRKGCFNRLDSYPSGLGDAIIKFILSHTDQELEGMIEKIDQLEWIAEEQVEGMMQKEYQHLHYPFIPGVTQNPWEVDFKSYMHSLRPPTVTIEEFRAQNPDFPPDIDDDEIRLRYIPAPFPTRASIEINALNWIPEAGEVIQAVDQHDLLERIWDGRQRHVIDRTDFEQDGLFCEYVYRIDFENKIMEVEGVVRGTLIIPFKDIEVGVIGVMAEEHNETEQRSGERKHTVGDV